MGKGDLWNALRGQVVETAKHSEVWREMDKFEKDKAREHRRGGEEKDEGRTRDPKTGMMMSGAQMRNARNAEGSVDWKDMFANDQRFSHVFDGAFTVKSKSQQVVDMDKMAAQAKAFAAARAKAETEGKASIGDPAAGASGDKRKRVGEDQGASAKKVAASKGEDRPPFALKPSDEALLKRITAVATMVAKNGQKFEDITRQKNAERRDEFSFLFGGEGEDYYLWLRYATKAGLNPDAPPGATPGFDPVALAEAARKIAEAAAATAPASGSPLASAATTAASTGLTAADWKEKSAATVAAPSQAFPPPVKPVSQGTWQAVKDAVGRTYYWNKVTNATTWDPPPGM